MASPFNMQPLKTEIAKDEENNIEYLTGFNLYPFPTSTKRHAFAFSFNSEVHINVEENKKKDKKNVPLKPTSEVQQPEQTHH